MGNNISNTAQFIDFVMSIDTSQTCKFCGTTDFNWNKGCYRNIQTKHYLNCTKTQQYFISKHEIPHKEINTLIEKIKVLEQQVKQLQSANSQEEGATC